MLVHGYKVGDKVRQQTLLNLGKLEQCPVEKHKALADRIETLLTGSTSMFYNADEAIETLAQQFVSEIQVKAKRELLPLDRTRKRPLKKSTWRASRRNKAWKLAVNGSASRFLTGWGWEPCFRA